VGPVPDELVVGELPDDAFLLEPHADNPSTAMETTPNTAVALIGIVLLVNIVSSKMNQWPKPSTIDTSITLMTDTR
jgi:hypothetical protein